MSQVPEVSRRQALISLLATLGGVGLVGCDSTDPPKPTSPTTRPTPNGTPSGPATPDQSPVVELPRTKPWVPLPGEVTPAAKLRATRLVEIACAWGPGESGTMAARRRIAERNYDPALVRGLAPLLNNGVAASVEVVNAQYGGILATSASVLMVVNQWVLGDDDEVVAGGTSLDVRLVLSSSGGNRAWTVTEVRPAQPRQAASQLSKLARQTLHERRIELPYAARLDIESGGISESVLAAMLALSRQFSYDVSVLQSGHPIRVFGTDRRSNHTDGDAVDVWAVDGRPVIGGGPHVVEFMEASARVGPYQIGGPVNLDGAGSLYFADATHQDHVHLGFAS